MNIITLCLNPAIDVHCDIADFAPYHENLAQVTLPWGTSSVGRMALFGCTRLAFVKMPATTRVADLAFDGCAPNLRVFGGVSAGRAQMV